MQAHPELQAECNGIQINYQCFGEPADPPVILIMGLGAQMVFWDEDFCQQLAALGYFVVRFDNRDIGKSSWLKQAPAPTIWDLLKLNLWGKYIHAPYKLSDMAGDTFALMDHLNIDSAHIVGVSMGGMIAQTMTIMQPHRVKTLTSIMSTTGSRKLPQAKPSFSFQLVRPMSTHPETRAKQVLKTLKLLNGKHVPFDHERVAKTVKLSVQRGINGKGVMRQLAAIIASGDRTEKLSSVSIPTLVIHGEKDQLVPLACGEATAKALPNARLKIYESMGHTLPSALWADILTEIHTHASGHSQ